MIHYNRISNFLDYAKGCLMGLVAISAISCSEDDSFDPLQPAEIPSSVTFNLPDELKRLVYTDETGAECLPLVKGETVTLDYTLLPEDITFKDVEWTSSDESVATVDNNGTVTAISGDGKGYSIVQVAPEAMFSGSGINDNIKVVVSNTLVAAENISIVSSSDEVYGGDTLHLKATILPATSTYKTVSWSTSDTNIATISDDGILQTNDIDAQEATVNITATALDGSGVSETKSFLVKKLVKPEEISIDQTYSVDNGYYCAINEQSLTLSYTTVPAQSTTSLIQWKSSDESIATVDNGVVTFNQNGNFGEVTITATCPDTGNSSSIKLNIPCGLIRETFHNPNHYSVYNAAQSGNGTETSHVWHDGYIEITTYTQNATNQRADIKWWDTPVYLHAGNYPIIAIKVEDALDLGIGVTSRNFNFDTVGTSASGTTYNALGGGNNRYTHVYKCSDNSRVLIYDLGTASFGTGGIAPTNEYIKCTVFQLKYADIKTIDHQFSYKLYWFQSFKSLEDVGKYIENEGLTYEQIQ